MTVKQHEQRMDARETRTNGNPTSNHNTPLGGNTTPQGSPIIRPWEPAYESPKDDQLELHDSTDGQMSRGTGKKLPVTMDGQQTQGALRQHEGDKGSQLDLSHGLSHEWKKETLFNTGDARELALFTKSIGANGSISPTPESWKNPNPATTDEARLAYERQTLMHQAVIAARESRDRVREEAERQKPTKINEWEAISATIPPTPTRSAPARTTQAPPPCENQKSKEHGNHRLHGLHHVRLCFCFVLKLGACWLWDVFIYGFVLAK